MGGPQCHEHVPDVQLRLCLRPGPRLVRGRNFLHVHQHPVRVDVVRRGLPRRGLSISDAAAKLSAYLSADASEAKKQLEEAEATKKTAETALRDAQKVLDSDAGPDGAYHVLRDRCFSVKVSQYTYEVCAFGRAKQDHTSLGNFREWRSDNTKWYFGGGQHCPGRGARDLVVSLLCGSDERLANVGEPETCSYAADLYTPAACG